MIRFLKVYEKSAFQISDHFSKVVFPILKVNIDENTGTVKKKLAPQTTLEISIIIY